MDCSTNQFVYRCFFNRKYLFVSNRTRVDYLEFYFGVVLAFFIFAYSPFPVNSLTKLFWKLNTTGANFFFHRWQSFFSWNFTFRWFETNTNRTRRLFFEVFLPYFLKSVFAQNCSSWSTKTIPIILIFRMCECVCVPNKPKIYQSFRSVRWHFKFWLLAYISHINTSKHSVRCLLRRVQ